MSAGKSAQHPPFTIVIPTFQRRDVVVDAVCALSAIDYEGDFEAIVVVDGSTDGTAKALAAMSVPFPLRVLVQQNRGAAAARNRGAGAANGDILLFLDDDMICCPDILQHHARAHADGADAVLGDIPLEPGSPPGFLARGVERWASARSRALSAGAPLTLFDLLTGHLSVRRSAFEDLGGFDERFTAGGSFGNEDLDFGTRLLKDHVVRFEPRAVSRQRYVVGPRQNLKQWSDAGRADVAFSRKHPDRRDELFALHGGNRKLVRRLLRPLAAVPGLARVSASIAGMLAERFPAGEGVGGRAVARLFFIARDLAYWSGVRAAGGIASSREALVLCYHAIADLGSDPILADYGISEEQFVRQVEWLERRGFSFICADDLLRMLLEDRPVPRNSVLLTFDDCYRELRDVARDILQPRGIPALAFSISGLQSNTWDQAIGARALPLLEPEGLADLAARRIEIGCHSRTHRPLPRLDDREMAEETGGAASDIESAGLPRPRAFAYPYGEVDPRSREATRQAGFAMAFGLRQDRANPQSDRFDLPRVEILSRDGGLRFAAKVLFPRLSGALLK